MRHLPAPATVNVRGHGQVPCVVEKETKSRYWIRWTASIDKTRVEAGAVELVPKGAVQFVEVSHAQGV